MSSSEARRPALHTLPALALLALIAGCTAGPLYGTTHVDPASGARSSGLTELRGRIGVSQAPTRTAQVFRNAILYRLNGATPVAAPIYELRFTTAALDQVASVESGTGIPTASLYRMTVDYQLVRLADGVVIARGQRFAMAPYDRSVQLYASERAVIDARDQAGAAVAERVLAAVAPILQRESLNPTPAPAAVTPPVAKG